MPAEPRAGEVHLWWADLDEVGGPEDERPAARRRAARREVLRRLVGAYSGLAPRAIELEAGPHGKPTCPAAPDLAFNCSSSGPVALCAFGRDLCIGVDVEYRADGRFEEMPVRRYMTEREREAFDPVRTWVLKEAVAKAIGVGLDLPPFGIEVERLEPAPAVRLTGEWAEVGGARWHVRFVGDERRVAALATDVPVELRARRYAVGVEDGLDVP